MKLFSRAGALAASFRIRRGAVDPARRWRAAAQMNPELAADLIRLGGIMRLSARRMVDGVEVLEPLCPIRMARDEGRREMAIELLSLMQVGETELQTMMEKDG